MSKQPDELRVRFESWFRQHFRLYKNGDVSFARHGKGFYLDQIVEAAWQGFQAAIERESGTPAGIDPIIQKAMNESSFALWQSHCDKKMQIETLTELCKALADSLETYADECHTEDVITERELIAQARKLTVVEDK